MLWRQMWRTLIISVFTTGAQAFAPAPIRWGVLQANKFIFVSEPSALVQMTTPSQRKLTIGEPLGKISPNVVPYFSARPDDTITWDSMGQRWCMEASGTTTGEEVRVSHCNGGATQRWTWLPWGPIQLKGTNQCLDAPKLLDNGDGLDGAPIALRECENKATESWHFEFPMAASKENHSSVGWHVLLSLVCTAAAGTLGLGAWLWRWQNKLRMEASSVRAMGARVDKHGGVCLTSPLTRGGDIYMKADDDEQAQTGHRPPPNQDMKIDPEELALQQRLKDHQEAAPKLPYSVECRSLVQYSSGYAVMSTNSMQFPGSPSGSVVGFAPDEQGRPLFCFSSMSSHTQDLKKDGRCSLTVTAKEFKGAADGRLNLIGECVPIASKEEREAAIEVYMQYHPNAFWTTFADFTWYRMEVKNIRFVGGFARAGSVSAEEYTEAKPDLVAAIKERVAKHMNDDHRDATVAMVKNYVGIDVQDAEIISMDSLGMQVTVSRMSKTAGQVQQFKLRVPWIRTIEDPKQVKAVIVQMTQASSEFMPKKEPQAADK